MVRKTTGWAAVATAAVALLGGTAACSLYDEQGAKPGGGRRVLAADIFAEPIDAVDLLFVIDNSGSMAEEQMSLAAWAEDSLFGLLHSDVGTRFDLHVAVVSSDMGAGSFGIAACTGNGDDGVFQSEPRVAGCSPPTGSFIMDSDDGGGGRAGNYETSLAETFACIAQLGIDGCGYEQPLEAARRALDGRNPENAGFLRPEALLAVVFVTDEDDCSAADAAIFDTAQNSFADPLGPVSSFRCFEFGAECDQVDLRTPGEKTGCVAAADPLFLHAPDEYIGFLSSVKPDPSMVFVGGLFADSAPVFVDWSDPAVDGAVELRSSCSGATRATPALRLRAVLDAFPCRNGFASICDGDLRWPLAEVSRRIADVANRRPCLIGDLRDVDEATDGVQPDCRVFEVVGEQRQELPKCASDAPRPCYRIAPDPIGCSRTDTSLSLMVEREDQPRTGARYVAVCLPASEE